MLAYLMLVHDSPAQFAKLVNALQGPDVMFFVHVDRKVESGQFRYMVRHHRNVRFLWPRKVIAWGGWNMVQAELALMSWALRCGAQYMVLLSGMDYPVWSNRRLTDFFLSSKKNYIEHYRIPNAYWDRGALNRLEQFWLCDDPIPLRSRLWARTAGRVWRLIWHHVLRRYFNVAMKLAYEVGIRRKPPRNLVPYIGSQWWCLTRECGEYVQDFVRRNPKIVRFYRHSHVPDEGFIQTVVMSSPWGGTDSVVNANLRYLQWDGGLSPRVLDMGDFNGIMTSGAAFARKLSVKAVKDKTGRVVSSDALLRALDEHRAAEAARYEAQLKPSAPHLPQRQETLVAANGTPLDNVELKAKRNVPASS